MARRVIVLLFVVASLGASAQEPHYSLFYQNPILLNPALSGFNECIMRIGGIYRDQWRTISKPYRTYSFFADGRIQPYEFKHDAFGVGLTVTGDKAGVANLGTTDAKVTFAYHKGLTQENKVVLSLGLSMGFVTHSLKKEELYFASQWVGNAFNTGLPSNEPFQKESATYYDMNAGLLLTVYITDYTIFNFGGTLGHITQPQYSFFGYENKVGMKTTLHTGLNAAITQRTLLMPKVYFSMQENTKEIVLGFNAAYYPRLEPIYLGLWYRWMGDLTPVVGMSLRGFNLMLSYDINISRLTPASKFHGGFEVSLIKNLLCDDPFFKKKRNSLKGTNSGCPIF